LVDFADTDATNNTGRVVVRGVAPYRILLVGEPAAPAVARLRQQLAGEGLEVEVRDPRAMLAEGEWRGAFDGVFLAEVGADQLPDNVLGAIDKFVKNRGGGLVVRGGETTFAPE
ncbi:MAG: hypothetical protein GTO04_05815, partial [Planctomycetales bacterium]|nr:hypothetical protein [Planctomycetales bacterium]